MTNKNKSSEVITVDAEEIPLEKAIDTALVKQNVTDTVIANLKKEFGSLRLKSIDDKESYLEVKEAKKNVRKVGILVEKVCKKGREDAVAIQKAWLAKERSVLAQIAEVEDPLQKEIDKYEAEQSRLEQQEIQRKENAYMQRQSSLLKLGANYANGCIILDEIIYETETIKNAESDFFDDIILPKYKARYEVKESVRIAEEKRRAEEADKIRVEREALEKEKAEMDKARIELQAQRDEADRIRREEDNKIAEAKRKVSNERLHKLMSVVSYDSIDRESVSTYTDEEFNKLFLEKSVAFEAKKKEDEEKRLAQIEVERKAAEELAVKRERERVEKEKQELEAKRIRDEQAEAERIAAASDKTKWLHVIELVTTIAFPEMKSPSYKSKVETAKSLLKKIKEL